MTSVEVPDLFFEVVVGYGVGLHEFPEKWVVKIKMAGIELYSCTYTNDPEISKRWTAQKALHAQGEASDPGPRPFRYAVDVDDARQTGMIEFAEHLKEVLSRADPMARY